MNRNVLKGRWKQIKGEILRSWGELTADDVDRAAGNAEKLVGVLQERYGWSKEEAMRRLSAFTDRVAEHHAAPPSEARA